MSFSFGKQSADVSSEIETPIIIRFTEAQSRGKAIDDFQKAMFSARAFFVEAHKNNTIALESAFSATPDDDPVVPPKFTKEELGVVGDMLKDNEVWMDELMKIQVGIEEEKSKDPVIWTKDLDERGKKLQSTVSASLGLIIQLLTRVWGIGFEVDE